VARWDKNRDGEQFVVTLSSYEGYDMLSFRVWFEGKDGEMRPTKKGIAFSERHLPALFAALRDAYKAAKAAGLSVDANTQ
jgi:hypothetical protein